MIFKGLPLTTRKLILLSFLIVGGAVARAGDDPLDDEESVSAMEDEFGYVATDFARTREILKSFLTSGQLVPGHRYFQASLFQRARPFSPYSDEVRAAGIFALGDLFDKDLLGLVPEGEFAQLLDNVAAESIKNSRLARMAARTVLKNIRTA